MSNLFIDSFREFVVSLKIDFSEEGLLYFFPKNNFAILLYPYEETQLCDNEHDILKEKRLSCSDILHLYEDRWFFSREMVELRILARLNSFKSIFARKCNIICTTCNKQIPDYQERDNQIKEFINKYHPYGYAKSKYRFALEYEGKIVAAAAFSAPRPMPRDMEELSESWRRYNDGLSGNKKIIFDSYEWVRYISLPDVRVIGGMGRLLAAFLKLRESVSNSERSINQDSEANGDAKGCVMKDRRPVEIMTYSDDEWSGGEAYKLLGFTEVAHRESITYFVDKKSHERLSFRKLLIKLSKWEQSLVDENLNILNENELESLIENNFYTIKNRGSRKFLLQVHNVRQNKR